MSVGYRKNENGDLEIFPEEAKIVRLIFDLYLQGNSILSIIKELENRGIFNTFRKEKVVQSGSCKNTDQ